MSTRIGFLSAAALAVAFPVMTFAAPAASDADWPAWIGRITAMSGSMQSPARQASHGIQYIPRSLILTGEFQKLLQDAGTTKYGTVETPWPEWVNEVQTEAN